MSILDFNEMEQFEKMVGSKEFYWIGLNEKNNEGTWAWSDNYKANYFNWAENQPDDNKSD